MSELFATRAIAAVVSALFLLWISPWSFAVTMAKQVLIWVLLCILPDHTIQGLEKFGRRLGWIVLLLSGPIVILGFCTAVHFYAQPPPPSPSGWVVGIQGPFVAKGNVNFYRDPELSFRRQSGYLYDFIDDRQPGIRHSLLVVLTAGDASFHPMSAPAYIQPAFMSAHPHPVVCDQGLLVGADEATFTSFTFRQGHQLVVTTMPTNCVTESSGFPVSSTPSVMVEAKKLAPAVDHTVVIGVSIFMLALVACRFPIFAAFVASTTGLYFSAWLLAYLVVLAVVGCLLYLVYAYRSRHVTVVAPASPFDPNDMKTFLRKSIKLSDRAEVGNHLQCADHRRKIERCIFEWFMANGADKIRDVGGSRTRMPEYSGFKHICARQNCNDDILRQAKDGEQAFDNCYRKGQDCPKRDQIRYAMLSFSDFYMTPDEILECVTGPTAIITHKFGPSGDKGGFGKIYDEQGNFVEYEANWVNNGNTITMTTRDGTPYVHGFNQWGTEGAIVGYRAAATYNTVWEDDVCSVILVLPASGHYDRHEPNVLKRAVQFDQQLPNGIKFEIETPKGDHWTKTMITYHADIDYTVPYHVPKVVSAAMGYMARDEKYEETLTSFTQSKLNAIEQGLGAATPVVKEHARMLADALALSLRSDRTLSGFSPLSDGYMRSLAFEITHRAWFLPKNIVRKINDVVNHPSLSPILSRFGVVHRVPTYERFTQASLATLDKIRARSCKMRFPGQPPSDSAGPDVGAKHSAASVNPELIDVDRVEGDQPGDLPQSVAHRILREYEHIFPIDPEPSDEPKSNQTSTGESRQETGEACASGDDKFREAVASEAESIKAADQCAETTTVDFGGHIEMARAQNRQLFDLRAAQPGLDGRPRVVLSVDLQAGDNTLVVETFNVSRFMSDVEQANFACLLSKLPRIPLRRLRCAIRFAVRAVGVSMQACGNHNHPTDCFSMRALVVKSNDPPPQGSDRFATNGVVYEIPHPAQAAVRERGNSCVVEWSDKISRQSKMLYQAGNNHKDDAPSEYISTSRRDAGSVGAADISYRTRDHKANQQKQKVSAHTTGNDSTGQGARPKGKSGSNQPTNA